MISHRRSFPTGDHLPHASAAIWAGPKKKKIKHSIVTEKETKSVKKPKMHLLCLAKLDYVLLARISKGNPK